MIDYDLPLMEFDIREMRIKSFIYADKNNNEFVKYKELLDSVTPKNSQTTNISHIGKLVTRVQAMWRGYSQRKRFLKS